MCSQEEEAAMVYSWARLEDLEISKEMEAVELLGPLQSNVSKLLVCSQNWIAPTLVCHVLRIDCSSVDWLWILRNGWKS